MAASWHHHFEALLPQIIDELGQYVEIETPTHDKEAVNKLGNFIVKRFADIGCNVSRIAQPEVGDLVRIEFGSGDEQILILGHFDTVKPIGTIRKEPWRIENGKIYGPGIFDMKAGIIFCYFALKTIIEEKVPLNKRLVFLWNTDEEIGSPFSKRYIEVEAKKSSTVLVTEPAHGQGDLKTSRKGGGEFTIKTYGRRAHAGNDHEKGINAIEEMAHQLLIIQSFTDHSVGTTTSVGITQGGSGVNVVPDYAEARIDVRAKTASEARKLTEKMHALTPVLDGARIVVEGGFDKLPMERTSDTEHLFLLAQQIAQEEGFSLGEASVGGMSDGNTTSALGIPTLDGLGAVGDGAHALHEHIVLDQIPYRIALLLRLFTTL